MAFLVGRPLALTPLSHCPHPQRQGKMRELPTRACFTPPTSTLNQRRLYSTRRSAPEEEVRQRPTASTSSQTSSSSSRVNMAQDWQLAKTRTGPRWDSFSPEKQALLTAEWRRRTSSSRAPKIPNKIADSLSSWLTAASQTLFGESDSSSPTAHKFRSRDRVTYDDEPPPTRGRRKRQARDASTSKDAATPLAASFLLDAEREALKVTRSRGKQSGVEKGEQVKGLDPSKNVGEEPATRGTQSASPPAAAATDQKKGMRIAKRKESQTRDLDEGAAAAKRPPRTDVAETHEARKATLQADVPHKDATVPGKSTRAAAASNERWQAAVLETSRSKHDAAKNVQLEKSAAEIGQPAKTTFKDSKPQQTNVENIKPTQDVTASPSSSSPLPVPLPTGLWDPDRDAINIVLFDIMGTLIELEYHPAHYYAEAIAKKALEVDREAVKTAFDVVFKKMRKEHPAYGQDSVKWWHLVATETFREAGVKVRPESTLEQLADDVLAYFEEGKPYRQIETSRRFMSWLAHANKSTRVIPAVPRLAVKVEEYYGNPFKELVNPVVKTGLASNSDKSVLRAIAGAKFRAKHLQTSANHIAKTCTFLSEFLQVEKPSQEFWVRVFEHLGRPRERAHTVVMIGDDLYMDAVPAAEFGCRAIWFDVRGDLDRSADIAADWPRIRDKLGVVRATDLRELQEIWQTWRREERAQMFEDHQRRLAWHDEMANHIMAEENLTQKEYAHKFDPPVSPPTQAEIDREIAEARVLYKKPRKGLTKKQLRKENRARKAVRLTEKEMVAAYKIPKQCSRRLNRAQDLLKRLHSQTDYKPTYTMADLQKEYDDAMVRGRSHLIKLRALYEHRLRTFKSHVPWVPFEVIAEKLKAKEVLTTLDAHLDEFYTHSEKDRQAIQAYLTSQKARLFLNPVQFSPKEESSDRVMSNSFEVFRAANARPRKAIERRAVPTGSHNRWQDDDGEEAVAKTTPISDSNPFRDEFLQGILTGETEHQDEGRGSRVWKSMEKKGKKRSARIKAAVARTGTNNPPEARKLQQRRRGEKLARSMGWGMDGRTAEEMGKGKVSRPVKKGSRNKKRTGKSPGDAWGIPSE